MKNIKQIYTGVLKRGIRLSFPLWQKMGFHVVPNHFYEPVPDTRTLGGRPWLNQTEMVGVDMNLEAQFDLLSLFASKYREEYDTFPDNPTSTAFQYYLENNSFISVDAEILYCMVRHFRPKRILEIGSGFSTFIAAEAVRRNMDEDPGYSCDFRSIDPYPNDTVRNGFAGFAGVIAEKVEDVPLASFEALGENDILFIDSSHVLKIGSDVQYEYMELIPRIKPGVVVHIHDIFLPAEYPQEWVMKNHVFWNEQYLLQSFLAFNESFEVLWSGAYMNLRHPEMLEKAFDSYRRNDTRPGSFWLKRIK
ncbi:MAG: class I SAM-dependent methyltransferase [Bacteroidales bacterium]